MKSKSIYFKATTALLCSALLFGCSNNSDSSSETISSSLKKSENLSTIGDKEITEVISEKVTYDKDDEYSDWENDNPTYIKLTGASASFDSSAPVVVSDNIITIKTAGLYVISGKLDDGQIVIDAEDKATVRIVLNGVEINSSKSAPIYVENAEKTVLSLQEGTENVISDGEEYVLEDSSTDEPNAAIFSKDNLTINGTGKLTVNGNYNNGITGKDELKITGGTIQITSVDDGLMGRDLLAIKEGNITIKAGGDAIKSTNDKDESKGLIAIEGGTFELTSTNDGIQAETSLLVADGTFNILAGGGSPDSIASRGEDRRNPSDNNPTTSSNTEEAESQSAKGLKAGVELAIGGGQFNIDSSDDALHSNNSVTIANGEMTIASGDDGIHGDSSILTKGGEINIIRSYEGIESKAITIVEGKINLAASDDGINVGGGNDSSGMDMQSASEDSILNIKGGYVYVNAYGDGLDSNGSIYMTGGTVIVSGPTDNGNGPLDYNGSFEMNGGMLIATGSAGMAQAASEGSSQDSMLMSYPQTQAAGTFVHLEDSKGNSIVTIAPEKDYQSVFISSPKLTKGTTYTLFTDGTSTGTEENGLYADGDYKGGTEVVEFTIEDSVTWLNDSGVTTGGNSQPGGPGGNRPEKGGRP